MRDVFFGLVNVAVEQDEKENHDKRVQEPLARIGQESYLFVHSSSCGKKRVVMDLKTYGEFSRSIHEHIW